MAMERDELKENKFETAVSEITDKKTIDNYQKCFYGLAQYPKDRETVFKLLEDSETWERMFVLVALTFTDRKIKLGTIGTAKAPAENEAAEYEVNLIDKEKGIIKCKLADTELNAKRDIFFDSMQAEFKITAGKSHTQFEITMWYNQKGNVVKRFLTNKGGNLESLMPQSIQQALTTFGRKLCNPKSFAVGDQIAKSIKDEAAKDYTYGLTGKFNIPESQEKIYAIISDFKKWPEIFHRFKYNAEYEDNKQVIKYELPVSYVMLNWLESESIKNEKLVVESSSGVSMIAGMKLQFNLTPTENKLTTCSLNFSYNYRTGVAFVTDYALGKGKLNDMIKPLVRLTIDAVLRHIYGMATGIDLKQEVNLKDEDLTTNFTTSTVTP